MELIAVPRPQETDTGNLFVRLTRPTAHQLAEILSTSISSEEGHLSTPVVELDNVLFLPLEIRIQKLDSSGREENIVLYASYNGGSPAPTSVTSKCHHYGHNDGIIELPLDLHPSLPRIFNSLSRKISVYVSPLQNVPVASNITIEPITTSDWEMIEMEASVLEDGGLLNQVTIVYVGQVIPLRLVPSGENNMHRHNEIAAWVKVITFGIEAEDKSGPKAHYESDDSSDYNSVSTVDDGDDVSVDIPSSCQCLRLMADTEVFIIPKPRVQDKLPSYSDTQAVTEIFLPSYPLRVQPASSDYCISDEDLTKSCLPSCPPLAFVYVHPSDILEIPGYRQLCENGNNTIDMPKVAVAIKKVGNPYSQFSLKHDNEENTNCEFAFATMCAVDMVHVGHIVLHAYLRYQLGVCLLTDWISVQLLPNSILLDSVEKFYDTIFKKKEKIQITRTSLLVEDLEHPWTFPGRNELLVTPFYNRESTCGTSNKPDENNRDMVFQVFHSETTYEDSTLFSDGSFVPLRLLHDIGVDISANCKEYFRVKLMFSSPGPLGLVFTAGDLKRILSHSLEDIAKVYSKGHAVNHFSTGHCDRLVLHPESVCILGFPCTPSIGFTRMIEALMHSALNLLSSSSHQFCEYQLLESRPMYIMVTGQEGAGKTHAVMHSALHLSLSQCCAVVYVDCKKLQAASMSTVHSILNELQDAYLTAIQKQPSILILDDLDCIIPNVNSGDLSGDGSIHHQLINPLLMNQVKVIVDHLILLSHQSIKSNGTISLTNFRGVASICTCRDKDSLCDRFKDSGLFNSIIEVPLLDFSERTEFFHQLLFGTSLNSNEVPRTVSKLSKMTNGFRPHDFEIISKRICRASQLRDLHESSDTFLKNLESDIATILKDYTPVGQQSLHKDYVDNSADWDSIGGLFHAKKSLHDVVIHPIKFKKVYDHAPTSLPTGLLIFGFPGSGKSYIIPSLAKKCNLNLITCRGPELLDRYIGVSEAKVRQLFAQASNCSPSLLFFDEFDSLAPRRGSDNTGVTDRVVNQLLTLLDGAESNKSLQIFVVAATSRPDKIDSALLRPGRLEKHVYFGYPESRTEWNSLFSSILSARSVDHAVMHLKEHEDLFSYFCDGLDYAKDFSAADLNAVMDTAQLFCVHEVLDRKDSSGNEFILEKDCGHQVVIGTRHIVDAFKHTRPSLLPSDKIRLSRLYKPFLPSDMRHLDNNWITFSDTETNIEEDMNNSNILLKTSLR